MKKTDIKYIIAENTSDQLNSEINFRLPRKTKKALRKKIFLYPPDKKGNSLMAFPCSSQKDYTAVKEGIAIDFLNRKSKKQRKEEWNLNYKPPVEISDEELVSAVNDTFNKTYRPKALSTLRKAKEHPVAIKDYHIFVNAYNLNDINTAIMAVDVAELNLKKKK